MASVTRDGDKGFRIRFYDGNGDRQQIRLSGITKATAEQIGRHVKALNAAKTLNEPIQDRQTLLWLNKVGKTIHEKLAAVGLVEQRASSKLGDFIAEFIADGKTSDGRPAAENTLRKWKQAQKVLNEFFGNRNLRDIAHEDAVKFRRWLDGHNRSENGKRTHVCVAKTFFNAAKRRKLVDENPFEVLKSSIGANRTRDFYLSKANAMKIIDACPDTQWKLMFALWRFAGLRKMEIFHLRWEHVLWDSGRMLVTATKTAHHEGKGSRFVPTGDILPWLEAAFNEAPEGSQRVITRFTESNVNLAKPFEKIITAAGFTVWPKLIQNLRASCETDWLDAGNPAHVVARWIGHSVKVQNDHYAQVDDHHFEQFNQRARLNAAESVAPPVAPKTSETTTRDQRPRIAGHKKTSKLGTVGFSTHSFGMLDCLGRGSNEGDIPRDSGHISETVAPPVAPFANDLQTIIDAWPLLSDERRQEILAITLKNMPRGMDSDFWRRREAETPSSPLYTNGDSKYPGGIVFGRGASGGDR